MFEKILAIAKRFKAYDTSELISIGLYTWAMNYGENDRRILYRAKKAMLKHLSKPILKVPLGSLHYLRKINMLPTVVYLDDTNSYHLSKFDSNIITIDSIIEILEPLTHNERCYLILSSKGYSRIEIANCLNISETFVSMIKRKLRNKYRKLKKEKDL